MSRVGYFNHKLMQQDAIRIFELAQFIQYGINGFDYTNNMEMALEIATAIYTTRMQVEHPDFNDTEVK